MYNIWNIVFIPVYRCGQGYDKGYHSGYDPEDKIYIKYVFIWAAVLTVKDRKYIIVIFTYYVDFQYI